MDYSAANQELWSFIIQLGLIAGAILLAQLLRQKVSLIRKSLMPVAVLAGFLLLIAKYLGLVHPDEQILEMLVYHGIALGFIAMSLRVPAEKKSSGGDLTEPVAILYWSYDRLSSWKMTRLPSAAGALTFYGVQTGWYSVQNPPGTDYPFTILFTEDGGDNWRPAANLSWDSVLQFITPAIGFGVATFNGMPALVRTSNSGFAWEQLFPMVVP